MKKVLMLALGLVACSASANIVITEYVEGGGYNKAIEISNLGSTDVKLNEEGYRLSLYTNGSISPSVTSELFGVLVPNSSLVIYNKGLTVASEFPAPLGLADSGVINHNGDDAIVLMKGDQLVDAIGKIGEDPGSYWGSSDDNTKDHSLRRLASVTSGDGNANDSFDPAMQWQFFAKDTLDGLGCAGEAACTGNEPKPLLEDGAPQDTCLFTTCSDITKVKKASDFVDATYYVNAYAATDSDVAAFKQALHQDIKRDHTQLTYNQVWTALISTDEDPANADNVVLLYTGKSISKANNASVSGNAPDSWNREHVWSKSHGFPDSDQLGYTDIHHLRPADASINSARSNYDFNNGGDPVYDGDVITANNSVTGVSWEPRAEVKGDVARMMFYMAVRYEDGSDNNMPDLILVDKLGTSGAEFGKLCALYDWHINDAVDTNELSRNNKIYEFQGNRNPFIDHPEWVEKIYQQQCTDTGITMPTVSVDAVTVNEESAVTLTANVNLDGLSFVWSQVSGTSVSLTGQDTASLSFTAPSVTATESLVFAVTVTDTDNNQASTEVEVTVNNIAEPTEQPKQSDSGGGSLAVGTLLLLFMLAMRRLAGASRM